jgi:hypothetical protein
MSTSWAPLYTIAFLDDGTVRLTEGSHTRSAKLSREDNSVLTDLLSRSRLAVELAAYRIAPGQMLPIDTGRITLSNGVDAWAIPGVEIRSLATEVTDLVDFTESLVRKYFTPSVVATRGDTRGGVKPNYWLKLTVRPVTGLACARPAPARPAA